jgi:integrase
MAGHFLPYHLIKRKKKNGKHVYYARFLNTETGETLCTRSTKQSNRAAAGRAAEKMLPEVQGELAAAAEPAEHLLRDYAAGFFSPGGPYQRRREDRGYAVGRTYLNVCEGITRNYVIPTWGAEPLAALTPKKIDSKILQLFRSGRLQGATVNKVLQTLRLILDEAVYEDLLEENPASYVQQVKVEKRERGVFSKAEIAGLFRDPSIWPSFSHYTLHLLAFTSGMRMGELRGLCRQNVFADYVSVRTQWEDKVGLKRPKAESRRDIAIPAVTARALSTLIEETEPERIVFYAEGDKSKPMAKSHIEKTFYRTLEKIGISAAERRQRNLVPHSLRHTLNTILRSEGVPDAKIQKITGHRTDDMTANYTHFQADDFRDVSTLTGGLIE